MEVGLTAITTRLGTDSYISLSSYTTAPNLQVALYYIHIMHQLTAREMSLRLIFAPSAYMNFMMAAALNMVTIANFRMAAAVNSIVPTANFMMVATRNSTEPIL